MQKFKILGISLSLVIFMVVGAYLFWFKTSLPLLVPLYMPGVGQPLPENIQYKMEAKIDHLPKTLMVYRFQSLNIKPPDALAIAERLGIRATQPKDRGEYYILQDGNKVISIYKDGRFSYFLEGKTYSATQPPKRLPDDEEAMFIAEKYAKELGIWRDGFYFHDIGTGTVSQGPGEPVQLIGKDVSFGRIVEGYKVWASTGIIIQLGDQGEIEGVKQFCKEIIPFKKYPLKDVNKAFQEMSNFSININPQATLGIIKSIELGYWEDPWSIEEQPFLHPVYVFRGEALVGDKWEPFIAFVPAVDGMFILK